MINYAGYFNVDLRDVFKGEGERCEIDECLNRLRRAANHLHVMLCDGDDHPHTCEDVHNEIEALKSIVELIDVKMKNAVTEWKTEKDKEHARLFEEMTHVDDGIDEPTPYENPWPHIPTGAFDYDCCRNCQNNPFVNPGASGFCNCTLPAMERLKYKSPYTASPPSYYDTFTTSDTGSIEKKSDFAHLGESMANVAEIIKNAEKMKKK